MSLAELDAEHTQKVLDMEQTQQMKLRERQKFFEEAFQQDMEQYLSTGYLQTAERRGKSGAGPALCVARVLPPERGWDRGSKGMRPAIFVLLLPLLVVLGFCRRYLENMEYIFLKH